MLKRFAVPGAVLLAAILCLALALLDVQWWSLPGIVTLLGIAVRITQLTERSGNLVATLKRNEARARVASKERYSNILARINSATPTQHLNAGEPVRRPDPIRPSREMHSENDDAEFTLKIAPDMERMTLWLEIGTYDIISGEFEIHVYLDGKEILRGPTQSHQGETLLKLGTLDVAGKTLLEVAVRTAPGIKAGIPPKLAFSAMVGTLIHKYLPRATFRIHPADNREVAHA